MIFQATIIANGILMLLHDAEKKGLIVELVGKIEEVSKKNLGKFADRVELEVIEKVTLQINRELVNDEPESLRIYRLLLERELEFIQGRIEAQADKVKRAD